MLDTTAYPLSYQSALTGSSGYVVFLTGFKDGDVIPITRPIQPEIQQNTILQQERKTEDSKQRITYFHDGKEER